MSAGFQLCAGAIIAANALRELGSQYRRRVVDDQLGQQLLDRRDHLDELEREQRERLHDARSVILGVKGATSLLADERFSSHVQPDVLQQMMSAELERLQHLLDTGEQAPCVEFDVREALRPVLVSHRLNGARIQDCVARVSAFGRPMDTATVVDNLLRNVARHAPKAAVTVSARRLGAHIEIVVEDDGPGIPAEQRARVLLPGVRGDSATSPGHGLGLSNSARAMSDQNGTLRIGRRRHGGTRVVLALPAAALRPADTVLAG
jgi:signal transduction histidine kinase